jgi:hypothetical protein
MKRIIWVAALLTGLVAGGAAGFAAGIFFYPFIFLKDIVADERVDAASRKLVASGQFIHANPADPVHHGKGKVSVYRDLVHLEGDFEVGPGPKYHVYLVPERGVTPSTEIPKTKFVDLGRLRAFKGSQSYAIPASIDPSAYGTVVVWCEYFGVLISPAELKSQ